MQIVREASAYQLVQLTFAQAAVAASQTAVALLVNETAAGAALANVGYTMPTLGEIVMISANLSAAGSAGTLTIQPTVNTTAKTDPALSITTQTAKSDSCPRNTSTFTKDAVIGCKITTDGSWNGTSADLVVNIWVIVDMGKAGI